MPPLLPETKGQQLLEWLRALRAPPAQQGGGRRVSPGDVQEAKRRRGVAIAEAKFVEQLRAKAYAEQQAERKFAFEQIKFEREQERKRWESILDRRIAYIEKLKPGSANRELAQERTRGLVRGMPPWAQQALAPHLERLFPPEVEKRDEFVRTNGRRPEVTADPTKDSFAAGMQRLEGDRYDWRLQKHMGIDPGAKFPSVAPAGPGEYIMHEEGDRPRLINLEVEALAKITESLYGSPTPEMVIANGGEWAMEAPVIFDVGRRKMKVTKVAKVVGKEPGSYYRTENIFTNPNPEETEPHPEIVNFASYYASGADEDDAKKTPEGRFYLGWLEGMEGGRTPNQALRGIREATGFNIKILKPGEFVDNWLYTTGYVKGKKEILVYWPGEPELFPALGYTEEKKGPIHRWFHDKATGFVYDGRGAKLGNYEEVLVKASEQAVREEER